MNSPDAQLVKRLLEKIDAGRWTELHELYAEDATVELPFHIGGPLVLEGREALRSHFEAAGRSPLTIAVHNVRLLETQRHGIVVAEFEYRGLVNTTGRRFSVSNVQVFEIHDGLIRRSRDYHDHLAIARALAAEA